MTHATPPHATSHAGQADAAPAARHPVTVIGCGLRGSPLPPGHAAALAQAQVLAGGARLLESFPEHPGQRIVIGAALDAALHAMDACRARGLRVAVLADGDPLFFGIGARLANHFGPDALRVLPAASCLQQAAARLALPWQDARCVSLHGRNDYRPLASALRLALHRGDPVCVLTDGHNTPGAIARFLIERGVTGLRLHAFADMGSPDERHATLALPCDGSGTDARAAGAGERGEPDRRDMPDELAQLDALGGNCTVLLVPRAAPARSLRPGSPQDTSGYATLPVLGIPDTDFAVQARLITKWPVRAAGLAALRIAPGDTVWDLGAGSGAVSVEAAALARDGLVVAVERDPARVALIEQNRRRFRAPNLQVIHAALPDCLDDLPDPDRVFIGGGLGGERPEGGDHSPQADPLLDAVCRRLPPGGRLVVHCVLLGTLERVRAALVRHGWPAEVACIQASEAVPLLGDLRLAALNPVFIVAATRPGGDAA
ncbi:bifunctional cobalt-precorrin-7 (C(5))-methyltransferase/cobalt-precorrin-6B (C(15))-methyltransferase [Nitratidesulfovibrio termitidis]|uniref:bifunctional cobalt-precorrin-7 (C(5))-methyltransferase/cobalt-precorrin-6B (C(15))-methyltransferase n=1 Tax=Nitratidesulfovibrio termitidis TaxID=42252 RepID=UPI000555A531|nr:bifunctional cobalt-precorrin-7 (C(5))-methyltransferase/cobalt-precorrin-6B (C(15))-methyltransferase [Nitratidesulfovibrio termitidis]